MAADVRDSNAIVQSWWCLDTEKNNRYLKVFHKIRKHCCYTLVIAFSLLPEWHIGNQ